MPRWVAPMIAAEMWNTNVAHVLTMVHQGLLQTHREGPFLLVDLDRRPPVKTPPTWTVVKADTAAKVASASRAIIDPRELQALSGPLVNEEESGVEEDSIDETADPGDGRQLPDISQWREVRRRVGGLRVPPRRAA